jgi:hypothetical protein
MTIRISASTHQAPLAGSMLPVSRAAAAVVPGHDLRNLGLEVAGRRLNAKAGDLDGVYVSRAGADVRSCPFCPEPHPEWSGCLGRSARVEFGQQLQGQ